MGSEFQNLETVPRKEDLSREKFEADYFARQHPVVVSGSLGSWRASSEWSPEFLRKTYGDVSVHASLEIPERRDSGFSYWGSEVNWMPLRDFVDHLESSSRPCYIRQSRSTFFPNFEDFFDFTMFLDMEGRDPQYGLWFGSKGTDSGVHWDTESNILAHIYGRKRAILFAPSDSRYLCPYRSQIRWSPFNAFEPDFTLFPNARNATPYQVDLNPGDAIHIPRGWWHQIISLDTAISINCFFQPSCDFHHFVKSVARAGPMHVAQTARDFLMLGFFRSRQKTDSVSDIPTGQFLYNVARTSLARRLGIRGS